MKYINKIIKKTTLILLAFGVGACTSIKTETHTSESIEHPTNRVVLRSDIVWEKLNPARGDNSPQAGTIWGDRNGTAPTGFLAKFKDGFSSPPHIHNVMYRAVVIKGLIHNDDPKAEEMWLPSGSFWTQPAGEPHITAAKGEENIAYVEIDQGPYLVQPTNAAFDTGARPLNVDAGNIVWLGSKNTSWIAPDNQAEISFLWESHASKGLKGLFIKLPEGFSGKLESTGQVLHAVVIQGELRYKMPQTGTLKLLDAGSYFSSEGKAVHTITTDSESEATVYVRTNGEIRVKAAK